MKTGNIFALTIIAILSIGLISTSVSAATASNATASNATASNATASNATAELRNSNSVVNNNNGNSHGFSSIPSLFLDNGTLDCNTIASELGGNPLHVGKACDVTVVRQSPAISGNNIDSNKLMNNVIEFLVISTSSSSHQVLATGNFTLLNTELKDVQTVTQDNGWIITETNNLVTTPQTTVMHWKAQGDINDLVGQTNLAFTKTMIKGLSTLE